jgi:hypothetical protein
MGFADFGDIREWFGIRRRSRALYERSRKVDAGQQLH